MGRRKSQLIHDDILAVASDLFYEHGINNVGISRIISDAGVAKMTLYSHFDSKQALVIAYLENRSREWVDWYRGQLYKMPLTPKDRLLSSFDVLDKWFTSKRYRGCLIANAIIELADDRHPAHEVKREYYASIKNMYLTLAQEADLRDCEYVAEQLFVFLREAMMAAYLDGPSGVVESCRKRARFMIERELANIQLQTRDVSRQTGGTPD